MINAAFVTDLHGRKNLYISLFSYLRNTPPDILLIGGDLLPAFIIPSDSVVNSNEDFINRFLRKNFMELRAFLGKKYPQVFLIMGNDDPRIFESALIDAGRDNLWTYIHNRKIQIGKYILFGYNYVPPTPFLLKDWERYDVSRYTDIGCTSPEEGIHSIPVCEHEKKWKTIKEDLEILTKNTSMKNAVFLFHTPPYNSALDLADLNGVVIDHVPLDPHVGSIAVHRFIEDRQPLLTLHGHVHESSKLSKKWMQNIGRTVCLNGACEGDRTSLFLINLGAPEETELFLL